MLSLYNWDWKLVIEKLYSIWERFCESLLLLHLVFSWVHLVLSSGGTSSLILESSSSKWRDHQTKASISISSSFFHLHYHTKHKHVLVSLFGSSSFSCTYVRLFAFVSVLIRFCSSNSYSVRFLCFLKSFNRCNCIFTQFVRFNWQ